MGPAWIPECRPSNCQRPSRRTQDEALRHPVVAPANGLVEGRRLGRELGPHLDGDVLEVELLHDDGGQAPVLLDPP